MSRITLRKKNCCIKVSYFIEVSELTISDYYHFVLVFAEAIGDTRLEPSTLDRPAAQLHAALRIGTHYRLAGCRSSSPLFQERTWIINLQACSSAVLFRSVFLDGKHNPTPDHPHFRQRQRSRGGMGTAQRSGPVRPRAGHLEGIHYWPLMSGAPGILSRTR